MRTCLRVFVTCVLFVLQLSFIVVVVGSSLSRAEPLDIRLLSFPPLVLYSLFVVHPCSFRTPSTWRGAAHGVAFTYMLALPAVAWAVALSLCIERDSASHDLFVSLLRRSNARVFAEQSSVVGGCYFITSLLRAAYEPADVWMRKDDMDLVLLEAAAATTRSEARAPSARRRPRVADDDIEMSSLRQRHVHDDDDDDDESVLVVGERTIVGL